MNCINCHAELKDDARFCDMCGASQTAEHNHCLKCGAGLKPGAKFCDTCGASQTVVSERMRKRRSDIICIFSLLAALLGAVPIFCVQVTGILDPWVCLFGEVFGAVGGILGTVALFRKRYLGIIAIALAIILPLVELLFHTTHCFREHL